MRPHEDHTHGIFSGFNSESVGLLEQRLRHASRYHTGVGIDSLGSYMAGRETGEACPARDSSGAS